MIEIDLDAVERHLELIVSDPPSRTSFRLEHPGFISLCRELVAEEPDNTPKPFPPISTMTAIQAAIFDNWPDGKKVLNHHNRYGMALEGWTEPARGINVAKRKNY